MFSSRLRSNATWAPLTPHLAASTGLNAKESSSDTFDLAIPIPHVSTGREQPGTFHALLLAPEDFAKAAHQHTKDRLCRLGQLAGPFDPVVIFLFASENDSETAKDPSSPLHAYMQLQVDITTIAHLRHIAILPIWRLDNVVAVVKTHCQALRARSGGGDTNHQDAVRQAVTVLLPLCTSLAPLSQHSTLLLTDAFASVKNLAGAVLTEKGRERVRRALADEDNGQVEAEGIIDFWKDEWLCE